MTVLFLELNVTGSTNFFFLSIFPLYRPFGRLYILIQQKQSYTPAWLNIINSLTGKREDERTHSQEGSHISPKRRLSFFPNRDRVAASSHQCFISTVTQINRGHSDRCQTVSKRFMCDLTDPEGGRITNAPQSKIHRGQL